MSWTSSTWWGILSMRSGSSASPPPSTPSAIGPSTTTRRPSLGLMNSGQKAVTPGMQWRAWRRISTCMDSEEDMREPLPATERLPDFVYGSTTYVVEKLLPTEDVLKERLEAGPLDFGARYILRGPDGTEYCLIPNQPNT